MNEPQRASPPDEVLPPRPLNSTTNADPAPDAMLASLFQLLNDGLITRAEWEQMRVVAANRRNSRPQAGLPDECAVRDQGSR